MSSKNWLRFWAAGLIWGTSFLWIKIAVSEVSPFVLVGFRTLFGTLGMLGIIFLNKKLKLTWRSLRPWLGIFAFIGFINVALPFVLISWGEQYIPSGIASVMNSTTPLFTIILATIFLKDDRLTLPKALGLLTGFGGVVLLFLPELSSSRIENLLGLGAVLVASASYAASGIVIKRKVHGLASELQVFLQYAFAVLMIWGITLGVERPVILPALPLTWTALLWLGLLGSSLASSLYFTLLHSVGPTRASTVTYVPPLVGLLLGAIFLGESLGWQTLIGGALIVIGIMLVNMQRLPFKLPNREDNQPSED
jgi:drug/metabolite transporter (DMT)-like permease